MGVLVNKLIFSFLGTTIDQKIALHQDGNSLDLISKNTVTIWEYPFRELFFYDTCKIMMIL